MGQQDKLVDLLAIKYKISHCSACDLNTNRIHGEGNPDSAKIMIIGEAGGVNEERTGRPYQGRAGKLLDIALKKCGIDRDTDIYISNCLKCRPPDNSTPTNKQVKACFPFLEREIEIVNPKVIITTRAISTAALTKERAITKVRGNIYKYKDYFVVPTYHPAYILRNPKMLDYLIDDIAIANSLVQNKPVEKNYIICDTENKALEYLKDLQENAIVYSCDIETTGLSFINDAIRSVQFSYKKHHAFYIPIEIIKGKVFKLMKLILTDPDKISVFQGGKFDNLFFMRHLNFKATNFKFDTLLMSHLIDVNAKHDLKSLSRVFPDMAGYDDELNKFLTKDKINKLNYKDVPTEILAPYGCGDVDITRRLFPIFYDKLINMGLLNFYNELTHPLQDILCDMEYRGIDVDRTVLAKLVKEYKIKVEGSEKAVYMYAGKTFNVRSTQQLGKILFKDMKLKSIKKTPTGLDSTDDEVLRKLSLQGVPIAQFLCDYRKFNNNYSTHIKAINEKHISNEGKVHCNYNMHIARTLRLSSSSPNQQNIPKDGGIREMYIPPKDKIFIIPDFNQIELRVLSFFSKDPVMLDVYKNDFDIHAATGLELFGKDNMTVNERTSAKEVNFGMVYGITAYGLVKNINESLMDMGVKDIKDFTTERDAELFIQKWFNKYKDVRAWIREEKKRLFNQGYAENYFGIRRRLIKLYSSEKRERAEALKEGISTIVQGTAACYINKAIVKVVASMKRDGLEDIYPTLPVHDEVAFVVPKLGDSFLKNVAEYISKELTTNVVPEIEDVVKIKVDYKICERWRK